MKTYWERRGKSPRIFILGAGWR